MDNLFDPDCSIVQHFKSYSQEQVEIFIKREDLLHPQVSGNKLRKLKYNFAHARENNYATILTYGGAYSNHIAATAAAGNLLGFKTIGVIRGEELGVDLEKTLLHNITLRLATAYGMNLKFVSRNLYRRKNESSFRDRLICEYGRFYELPEGGTNGLAVKGCAEILERDEKSDYDVFAVAAGTGGTAAGVLQSVTSHKKVIVCGALKGKFLKAEIEQLAAGKPFDFFDDSEFGGYAKSRDELIGFMNLSFRESGIPLEPIYTGKLLFKLDKLIRAGYFKPKTRILAIHTGGMQSISSYNQILNKKGRLQLNYLHEIS
ncbi:MAG: pyridoxal-phosphate dependent enzyme [Nonlabens sp.]